MIAIQLFGITESKSLTVWAELVRTAMRELGLEYDIQVVGDLQAFMQHDLIGIPALLIGEEVVFQRHVPTLEEVKAALQAHLAKKQADEEQTDTQNQKDRA